jgi:hypothetical protein
MSDRTMSRNPAGKTDLYYNPPLSSLREGMIFDFSWDA